LTLLQGGGTTMISAMKCNRKYYCIEKDIDYYNLIKEREITTIEQTNYIF